MHSEASLLDGNRWTSAWKMLRREVSAKQVTLGLCFIILMSFAFRLHLSSQCSLWLDEVLTHTAVLKPWPDVLKGPTRGHPPLMYVLAKAGLSVFGDNETGLRSASLLFGCLWLAAVYELARELGLSGKHALVVVATFAVTPFFVRHATEARHYAILCTFCTLATTRTLRLLRGPPRTRDLLVWAVCVIAAPATQYFGLAYALALLGAVVAGIVINWRRASSLRNVVTLGVLLACLVPLGVIGARVARLGHSFGVSAATSTPETNWSVLREIGQEFSFLTREAYWPIEAGLALVGLVSLTLTLRGVARVLPLGLGAAPCLAAALMSTRHPISPRYVALSGVFFHLGACVTLFAVVARARSALATNARVAWLGSHVGGLLLAVLLGARLNEYPGGFPVGIDDYRGMQRYFQANLAQDTALVAYPGDFGKVMFGRYYNVGSAPIRLEKFRPRRGTKRYLIATIHAGTDERQGELEKLVTRHFHLSPEEWRAMPTVPMPHSAYQSMVFARLVQLPRDWTPPPRKHRPRKKRPKH